MLFDLKKDEKPDRNRYDLAIIGAGAAGITIAREFSDTSFRILLVESGDFEFDRETQNLYQGETEGNLPGSDDYLRATRLRFFGGSTNHWNGWCRPLDPHDFRKRDWVPNSGWPISKDDLEPYYRGAEQLVGIDPFPELDRQQYDWTSSEMDLMKVRAPYSQFSTPPTRFGREYREDVLEAENIDIIINANLNDLRLHDGNPRVNDIHLISLNQKKAVLHANYHILACGGIENPRLLLNFRSDMQEGLGNQHGLVGKYFIEHPHYFSTTGWLLTWSFEAWDNFRYKIDRRIRYHLERARTLRVYSITEEAMREEKLLNFCMDLTDTTELENSGFDENEERIAYSLKELSEKFLIEPGVMEEAIISKLYIRAEQEPRESNMVSLIQEKDQLGMQKVKLRCQVQDHELDSHRRSLELMGRAFGLDRKGRMKIDLDYDSYVAGGAHHMGTTRMSDDPGMGVVDENCKVHGIENLFIAGSSVFPTSGFANPTLTIVALSLRLTDHIKTLLSNG